MRFHGTILAAALFCCLASVRGEEAAQTPLEVVVDVSETPEHEAWAKDAAELVKVWHPKLVAALPSDGFKPPRKITLQFKKDMKGVAHTIGDRIVVAGDWITKQPEDKGMVVHELTHAIQAYRRAPRDAAWLVEGIADYTRFYLYEPTVMKPNELRRARYADPNRVKYDNSYRITASFLNYLVENVDREIVVKLNAALRDGTYDKETIEKLTKKTPSELEDEWRVSLRNAAK